LAFAEKELEAQEEAASEARKTEEQKAVFSAAGLVIGGVIGSNVGGASGGPYGAIIGAVIGGVVGGCLIISACDGPESYEVQIARRYRDQHMTLYELVGYYTIAPPVAHFVQRNKAFKRLVKTQLVNRLVDYAEWLFEIKPKMDHPILSNIVTKGFLGFCRIIGKYKAKRDNYGIKWEDRPISHFRKE
jgi:hypothetical protein